MEAILENTKIYFRSAFLSGRVVPNLNDGKKIQLLEIVTNNDKYELFISQLCILNMLTGNLENDIQKLIDYVNSEELNSEEANANSEEANANSEELNSEDVNSEEANANSEDVNSEEANANSEDVNSEEANAEDANLNSEKLNLEEANLEEI